MGVETAALALGAGSNLLGGVMQYGENRAARKRAGQIQDQALGIASQPLNIGQDSFLQYLRSNPNALTPFMFDSSQAFQQLQAQDKLDTADQVAGLRAGAGSLGERFGGGFAAREAMLRSRLGAATGARNAGIAQNSFNTALNAGLNDFQNTRAAQIQALLGARGQQLQALGLGAGINFPSVGAQIANSGSDIAQLLLVSQLLGNKGSGNTVPTTPTTIGGGTYGSGFPTSTPPYVPYSPPFSPYYRYPGM